MNVGIYKGASAMAAYERWQQAVTQNLASASVNGYRKTDVSFKGLMSGLMRVRGSDGRSQKEEKGVVPEAQTSMNMLPGNMVHTGVSTNFAIEGPGFFRVQKPDGTIGYTRNGNFRMSNGRTLVTQEGFEVDGGNGQIKFRQEGGTISLNPQGSLIQGNQIISKLTVFQFNRPGEMRRIGDGLLAPAEGDAARPSDKPTLVQMVVESSNVAPMQEMVSMINIGRAYEMARKVVDVEDDNLGKAIQGLGATVS
ncbi:MAG: Flagellar basal-body rod protein FlgG [Verrucomicrobiota bacterium]|jgi:flagellar basal-body rod protein FlgG